MSVLPLKADIRQREWHVRYVPIADIAQQAAPVAVGQVTPYKILGSGGRYRGAVMQAPCCCSC
jgi:hypothetical protein